VDGQSAVAGVADRCPNPQCRLVWLDPMPIEADIGGPVAGDRDPDQTRWRVCRSCSLQGAGRPGIPAFSTLRNLPLDVAVGF
jgi:hypothetical protein